MKLQRCMFALAGLLSLTSSSQAAIFSAATLFANAPAGATGPDSVTAGFGSVWVSYSNGVSSTGTGPGNSTIVQYSLAGAIQNTYSIPGSVDGLKINPNDGNVWALANQDGNSSVTLINPATRTLTNLTYATTSPAHGYDDIVFSGNNIFLSYTNPAAVGDTIIVSLNNRMSPLTVTPIVMQTSSATQSDPDSLKLDRNGNLVLSSGDDGALSIVSNPGQVTQSLSTIAITNGGSAITGLDDTFLPPSVQGNLYIANTGANQVLVVSATGLLATDIYADAANSFGQVDRATGIFTSIIPGLNAPHGLDFVSTPEPGTLVLGGTGLILAFVARRKKRTAKVKMT